MSELYDDYYNEFEDYSDEDDFYEEDMTWGQQRGLCDIADNCFECPFAGECF